MTEFSLTGPRGDNPLGFLTALGTVVALEDAGYIARLAWDGLRPRLLVEVGPSTEDALIEALHKTLQRDPSAEASKTQQAKKALEKAKTLLKKKREEVKKRKLDRETRACELEPIEREVREKEIAFKRQLVVSGADPTVTLGRNLTVDNAELIKHVLAACETSSSSGRRWVDLATAYGIADPAHRDDRMLASPWALVSGSGHQDFLSSIEELMVRCTAAHLSRALFGPWEPCDEKYSLRLDASDDRRYALLERDPTATGNKPLTLWGANRLAFEALRYFPAMPVRGGMGVRAWRGSSQNGHNAWLDGCRVRWPLWGLTIRASVVGSLLGLGDLWSDALDARARLRGLGVRAVMESVRIAVGDGPNKKFNLTPAVPVWAAPRGIKA